MDRGGICNSAFSIVPPRRGNQQSPMKTRFMVAATSGAVCPGKGKLAARRSGSGTLVYTSVVPGGQNGNPGNLELLGGITPDLAKRFRFRFFS
jgi:hypothetical protein